MNLSKMKQLKTMTLLNYLTPSEVIKIGDCDFEFTIIDGKPKTLEIWHNPKGKHKYREKYRREFEIPDSISFNIF
jgi:hypothetical protein